MDPKLFSVISLICVVFILLGNMAVLLIILRSKELRQKPSVVFIVNGAVANVIYSATTVVASSKFINGHSDHSQQICHVFDFSFGLTSNVMVLTGTVISLDKYYAVLKPFFYRQYSTLKRSWILVAIVWIVSIILAVPMMIAISTSELSRFCNQQNAEHRLPIHIVSEVRIS